MKYSELCYYHCAEEGSDYADSCSFCKLVYEESVIEEHENRYREMTEEYKND